MSGSRPVYEFDEIYEHLVLRCTVLGFLFFAVISDVAVFIVLTLVNTPLPEWTYPFLFYIQVCLSSNNILCVASVSTLYSRRLVMHIDRVNPGLKCHTGT